MSDVHNIGEVPPSAALVLVVEDDPHSRELLVDMLAVRGYRCVVAKDGESALASIKSNPPDVILLDVMMPKMDGFEVCRRIKQDPATAIIPVLMITALSERVNRLRGMDAGANDFLIKPIDCEEVALRVRNAVESKKLHDRIQAELVYARELEILRDNLTHFIVHDQRSLLMGIACGLQVMSEQNEVSAENRRFLDIALGATQELNEMVSAILDLSRMESHQMPLRREICDLVALAKAGVQRTANIATYRMVQVQVTGTTAPADVDRELIERIFANLLTNAFKFSPARSQITVTIFTVPGRVRVEVVDQGPGIPPEYHQSVFEKFGQVENRLQNRKYSTGLGLAFCKVAVELHGGQIGVKSELGKGSTYWFELPNGM